MDPILELAEKYDLKIIEDAAQAHGAEYKDRRVGSIGNLGCFSFYPGKNLGAYGDAGAIVTSNERLANDARMFANHGRKDKYNHEIEGINSRMDGLQGAVLNVKLSHLANWTDSRRQNAFSYNKLLEGTIAIPPSEPETVKATYHLYVIRTNSEIRDEIRNHLQSNGISSGIHYPIALPNLDAYCYLQHTPSEFPEATRASKEIISLPLFPELTTEQLGYIVKHLKDFPL
jgi:dTDP-4-amino-4,6-dideoxygalactose transaminase